MFRLLRRLLRRSKPLTDTQRLELFIAMQDRFQDQLEGKPLEPMSAMLIRLGVKQPNPDDRSDDR